MRVNPTTFASPAPAAVTGAVSAPIVPVGGFDTFQHLGAPFQCPAGCSKGTHDLEVKLAVVQRGAIQDIAEIIRDPKLGLNGVSKILLVCDAKTYEIAGRKIGGRLLSNGFSVRIIRLPPKKEEGIPLADEGTAKFVESNVSDNELLLAVGGGTVLDMTRLAAFKKEVPFIAIPTAPSMNGYVSRIVAMEERGVKVTKQAKPPLAVVCDLDILANAPEHLRASGFGDLMSKPTSFSDWLLSSSLEDSYFCALPMASARLYEARCIELAEAIRAGSMDGIETLAGALINSGFSMIIAGSSSPASGGEHLISHLLDMTAGESGRHIGLHGMQVGVATMLVAPLYEEIVQMSAADIDANWERIRQAYQRPDDVKVMLKRAFPSLAGGMVRHSAQKWNNNWGEHRALMQAIISRWDAIREKLKQTTSPWQKIQEALAAAGAVTRIRDIKTRTGAPANIIPEEIKRAFLYARYIRGRYTILDLASDLGLLDEAKVDEIIKMTGVLG